MSLLSAAFMKNNNKHQLLGKSVFGFHFHNKYCEIDDKVPMDSVNDLDIDINDFILDKYVAAKPSIINFKVVFNEEWNNELGANFRIAQQRCDNLTFPFARSPVAKVRLTESVVLVDGDDELNTKRVEQLTLDCSSSFANIDYEPGDTVAILPINNKHDTDMLLVATGFMLCSDMACRIRILPQEGKKPTKLPPYIPELTTPREILESCLNVHAVPKKQFLSSLAQHCDDNAEREFLSCLSSREGSQHYNTLFIERGLTLIDLLSVCTSCKPPFELLIEHLPRLLPRPYSIANSPLTLADHKIRIIYSIRPKRPGVTTAMLTKMSAKLGPKCEIVPVLADIHMYFRETNKFRYTTEDVDANQILISIGTGLAPFIGFLEHKQHRNAETASEGETWLFAGATTEQSIIYRDFLKELQNEGVLQRYQECLSRVPDAAHRYVQDVFVQNSSEFVEFLMKPETTLYLCADGANISKSIQASIADCMMKELHLEEVVVMEMIKSFRASGKYREDLWA